MTDPEEHQTATLRECYTQLKESGMPRPMAAIHAPALWTVHRVAPKLLKRASEYDA